MSALIESWTGLQFLSPWWLLATILLPLALLLRQRHGRAAVTFAPAGLWDGEQLPRSWRVALRGLPRVIQVAGLLCVVVALARPVERTPLPLQHDGIDIVLCMDTSSSMTARDLDAGRTRLGVALDAAARFVSERRSDRIGLVTFARYPDVRCPPTLDHEALRTLLGEVQTVAPDSPEDATGIGTAVARAAQVLGTGDAASKVVILLTDGEENVATEGAPDEIAPLHAAQLCEELGVRVYTIAAGAADVPGRPPLDTRPVQRLSERTGGAFFIARDAASVAAVYDAIDELERVALDAPRIVTEERYAPLLAGAVLLLLVGQLLAATALRVVP